MKRILTIILGASLCFGSDTKRNEKIQKLSNEVNRSVADLTKKQVSLTKELELWRIDCQAEGKKLDQKSPNVLGCVATPSPVATPPVPARGSKVVPTPAPIPAQ